MIKQVLTVFRNLYHRRSSSAYLTYLRSIGVEIGEGVTIFSPQHTNIDETRPWLIKIGDDVQITSGVTILTHGFDWCVLKKKYGRVLGSSGMVSIGNNVFIGTGATILKGVTIGHNVIIGAKSVVSHDIPDNSVAVGTPARVIMSIDEYYKKRLDVQEKEAHELVHRYREVYHKEPDERVLSEFFFLYESGDTELNPSYVYQMKNGRNQEESYRVLRETEKEYHGIDDFLKRI